MSTEYLITMDVHCRTSDICIKTRGGKLVKRGHVGTGIRQLREVIGSVPRPRYVLFEEGALAGWLYRELKGCADEVLVCDPRRNAHVAKDGDKDDAIDAEKLNDLWRAGMLRLVHQMEDVQKAAIKQLVGMYHDRVVHRVGEAGRLLALCRRWGVMLSRSSLLSRGARHPVRSLPIRPYVVYFRVLDDDRVVRILTIRHGAPSATAVVSIGSVSADRGVAGEPEVLP